MSILLCNHNANVVVAVVHSQTGFALWMGRTPAQPSPALETGLGWAGPGWAGHINSYADTVLASFPRLPCKCRCCLAGGKGDRN